MDAPAPPGPQVDPPFHRRVMWRLAWLLIACTIGLVFRVRVTGRENVPAKGGALLVANHTTAMDFMMPSWGVWRPVFGIGAERVLGLPVLGWVLRQLNGAPVSQGVKDKGAVMHLVEAYGRGQLVMMFPEGTRSWTGRPLPITPGSGRLVKSLGCPVLYCRITTGHLVHPRWATWPRLVPFWMGYDPLVHYAPDTTVEEINADIARHLRIDPDQIEAPPRSYGFRMAEGLPSFLWACPACFAVEALEVRPRDRNSVVCRSCKAVLRVDVSTRLHSAVPGVPVMTVAAARDRITPYFGRAIEPDRFARDGVVLEAPMGTLSRLTRARPDPEPMATGRVQMFADRIEVVSAGDGQRLTLQFVDLKAAILEFRSMLVLRTVDTNWALQVEGESPHKWHDLLSAQIRAAGLPVRV